MPGRSSRRSWARPRSSGSSAVSSPRSPAPSCASDGRPATSASSSKWFFLAAAALPLGLAVHLVAETFFLSALDAVERGYSFAIVLLPIAIGIAILKYRLYEIDRIISRTLVYGGLTLILGAVYIGLVLAGQALSSSFAGGSNLAIAASTLAVAALFLPGARACSGSSTGASIDGATTRNGRSRPSGPLREQVDLESLSVDLRAVVDDTMQPAHVGLWLRKAPR